MTDGKPIAKFAPSIRAIKLFGDGRIDFQGRSSSIIGATARVDASGSKRVFRDTREVFLIIEGPRVGIAEPLGTKSHLKQKQAHQFAAKINELAMRLAESAPAPTAPSSSTESSGDTIGQLERLGKLRESGVLTEEEFQAQKSAVLPPPSGTS